MLAPVLIVAATSARMLAESARRGGLRPVALDIFGDVDTRRAAHWLGIGNRTRSRIDSQRLHAALSRLARHPQVRGWVAGGGFEDRLDLLQDCARTLTLIGNEPAVIGVAKQPADFFGILDRHGIPHPETSLGPPAAPAGWLAKRVGGTGGWHVRRLHAADDLPANPRMGYYQREEAGQSMSALFLANGRDAMLIGYNLLLASGGVERPFVFQGAVGPIAVPAAAARVVEHAVAALTRRLELKGLNSLDFLLDGDRVSVIEVNPRPSATMELHDHRLPGGLVNAHLAACRDRALPQAPSLSPADGPVRGMQIIYAPRRLAMTRHACRRLQALGWCHDIGREGTRSSRGDPLCSISAQAESADAVVARLACRATLVASIHEEEHER